MNTSTEETVLSDAGHCYSPESVALVVNNYRAMRGYLSRAIGRGEYPNNTQLRKVALNDDYMPKLLDADDYITFRLMEGLITSEDVTGAVWVILENDCKELGALPIITVDRNDGRDVVTFY